MKNIAIGETKNETESVVHEDNNIPLNKVATMIQGGNIELTTAIEMVHKYNLMINEGKNLNKKDTLVHEETKFVHEGNELHNKNRSAEMLCAGKIEKPSNTEITNFWHKNSAAKQEKTIIKKEHINLDGLPNHLYDFCEICREKLSKNYLKRHMLRMHQIEMINNRKNQTKKQNETIQERKDPLTNHELVNRTEGIHEEKVPIANHTEIKQKIPKYEEIKVKPVFVNENSCKEMESKPGLKNLADERHSQFQQYIKNRRKAEWGKDKYLPRPRDLGKCPKCQKTFSLVDEYARHINKCVQEQKNPCSQCNATFTTKRRLSIHIELVHDKNKEDMEMPKPKKQKTS